MQIVPSSGGMDASRKLFAKPALLSPDYLYNPEQNIEVGAAYLNVLYYDYLRGIKNPDSRLYYAIAAHNGGASGVARAFVDRASFKDAMVAINAMTPDQVLHRLLTQAPSLETRNYVKKVMERRQLYTSVR